MRIYPRSRPARGKRRAVFFVEMLGILVILGAAALFAGELFISSLTVMQEANKRDTLIGRVDTALDVMRRDAWAADSAKATVGVEPGSDALQLHVAGGDITWQMHSTTLTRTDAGGSRKWVQVPQFKFTPGAKGTIRVEVDSGPAGAVKHEHVTLATPRITGGPQ